MSINKNFCHHAFTGLDINPYGLMRPCCKFDISEIPAFSISNGIAEYRNSAWLKQLQYQFIKGERPTGCHRCWSEEDAGIESKRQLDYARYKPHLDHLSLKNKDFTIVGIAFNNLCNLACRICGPWASSTWIAENKKANVSQNGKVSTWHKLGKNINDLFDFSKNATLLEIVGGEPFLSDFTEHLTFLQKFIDAGNAKDVSIHYTTNGTVIPDQAYFDAWKQFKHIDIQISIDDTGKRFEYNRWPAKWSHTHCVIKELQSISASVHNIDISLAYTVSAFTIAYADQFVSWCKSEDLPMPWFGLVTDHPYYSPHILPSSLKDTIRQQLHCSQYPEVTQLAEFLDTGDEDVDTFLHMVTRLDQQRNQSFHETFPELVMQ